MAKIDYSKAEREMHTALQRMRVKNLAEGKSVTSQRAAEYYGLNEPTPRPTPEEPVAKLLREEAANEELAEEKAKALAAQPPPEQGAEPEPLPRVKEKEAPVFEVISKPPVYDVMRKARGQSQRPPKFVAQEPSDVPPSDKFLEPASQLYILRQHILWLKRKHYDNRYEMLGTTREEIMSFRRSKRLSEEQNVRIKELNSRAEEVKAGIMAEEGMKTEDKQIEKQQIKHKTKRFNVKETWLPL
jgi:hypothetical protein